MDDKHQLEARLWSEVASADERYGPFKSSHEGLGVLTEEVSELISAIRSNDHEATQREAIQVAAVAFRLAVGMHVDETRWRSAP